MESEDIVCPVCTLFLRPGITLKQHLTSHPKQKVIEALVRLSNPERENKVENVPVSPLEPRTSQQSVSVNQTWNQSMPGNFGGNHSFIYQQFMSTSSPQSGVLNVNPLTQQYVTIPTVFNPQMMCPPYVYQQQQVIMSSGPSMQTIVPRPLPIELPAVEQNSVTISDVSDNIAENEPHFKKARTTQTVDKECDEVRSPQEEEVTECDKIETVLEEEDDAKSEKKEEDEAEELLEQDDTYGCPRSNDGSEWSVRVKSLKDLSKACQTQANLNSESPAASPEPEDVPEYIGIPGEQEKNFYYPENVGIINPLPENHFSQNTPVYTITSNNVIATGESASFVDLDRMPLILSNDFLNNQIISQVHDFDNVTSSERPHILMTIGSMENSREVFNEFSEEHRLEEENVSRESAIVSIRADERMPARGELSGQESNGAASDITWSRVQYGDDASEILASYELVPREEWEVSDCSDSESAPVYNNVNANVQEEDAPTIVSYSSPPLNFKCSRCDQAFKSVQDRSKHVKENHQEGVKILSNTLIGVGLEKKKVKKLIVKPKKEEVKSENNFDNVFTNKLKLEASSEVETTLNQVEVKQPTIEIADAIKSDTKLMCALCDSVLPNRRMLHLHKYEAHKISGTRKHKCATCEQDFPNEYRFTEHLRVHPLECRICGKYFYKRVNMQLHMKRHLGIKPYKCDVCDKAFLTRQKHDEHRNIHTGESPIKCYLCNESFRRYSNLVQHKNTHHLNIKKKVKDFICSCGEIFHSKKKLAWHKEVHDPKPKACSHCTEKFIHMSSLTRHMRRAHNERFVPKEDRNNENVECPICKGVFIKSSLAAHVRNHSGQRPYTCSLCNKDFTTKWNLKFHKWTHASRTSKPFKCELCKGAFIRETEYVAHMNSHKSVKPYTCNYCGAQFIRKCNRQRHVKEHEKSKNFNCQVCGKAFHRSYYLKDHMRIHSDLRPYTCHICGKTSRTKSNHNKHVRIHHAREPVSTEN